MNAHAHKGFVYTCMERTVWGLPQAGILANKLLQKRLAAHGYYKYINMPSLWQHAWRSIQFTLVINNFGIKYVGKEHVDHLTQCIKEKYKLTKDWTGDAAGSNKTGITVRGHLTFQCQGMCNASFKNTTTWSPPVDNIAPTHRSCENMAQMRSNQLHLICCANLIKKEIKRVQKIVGSILYNARAVDMAVLIALSTIASKQTKGTKQTLEKALQVLDYLATHPNATVHFSACNMILNIHLDASHLSEPNAQSWACGYYFLSWLSKNSNPICQENLKGKSLLNNVL